MMTNVNDRPAESRWLVTWSRRVVARIRQGGILGADLLARDRFTDVEVAKQTIASRLSEKIAGIEFEWVDRT
jgi:hypothetical protein